MNRCLKRAFCGDDVCSIAADGQTAEQEVVGDSRRSVRDSILAAASDVTMGEDIAKRSYTLALTVISLMT